MVRHLLRVTLALITMMTSLINTKTKKGSGAIYYPMDNCDLEGEIWKEVPGYEGRYVASNLGRVKSCDRCVYSKNRYTHMPFKRNIKGQILRPGSQKSGHITVSLGRKNSKPVHEIICLTFIGKPTFTEEVRHLNGNPKDNRLCNLAYGTRTENILDVFYQGKRWRKLNMEEVEEIRFGLACGFKGNELARMYGVSDTTISYIKSRRIFGWM